MIYDNLENLGLKYTKSHGNFVFFETGKPIDAFSKAMAIEGVDVGRPFPPYTKWCRISTGLESEVEAFNAALRKVMG